MPLAASAVMVFTDYAIEDQGIKFHFVSSNPGAGQPSDYYIFATDAELAGITTTPALATMVTNKLNRAFRAAGVASKLDPLLGSSITI